jgi:hypothetical protein
MPEAKLTDQQLAYRNLVADGARHNEGSHDVARRIDTNTDPVRHAAAECNALRCELRALADATGSRRLRFVAAVLGVAADDLGDYAATGPT